MARRVGGFRRSRVVTPGRGMMGSPRSMPAQRDTGVIQMSGRPVFEPEAARRTPRETLNAVAVDFGISPAELAAWRLQMAKSMR